MSLPLLAATLIRELALEAEKRPDEERAAIESLMAEISRLGDALGRLMRDDVGEMDLAHLLAGIKSAFDDEHVHAAARQAQDTCAKVFAAFRLKRQGNRELTLNPLITDLESVMLAIANLAARSF